MQGSYHLSQGAILQGVWYSVPVDPTHCFWLTIIIYWFVLLIICMYTMIIIIIIIQCVVVVIVAIISFWRRIYIRFIVFLNPVLHYVCMYT